MEDINVRENTMENAELYSLLLPEDIYDLFKQRLATSEIKRNETEEYELFFQWLTEFPYPLFKILNCYSDLLSLEIRNIVFKAVQQFTEASKVVCLIANFPLDICGSDLLHNKILEFLYTQHGNNEIYLALLCRNEVEVFDDVLKTFNKEFWTEQNTSGVPSIELILEEALKFNKHYVTLWSRKLKQYETIKDVSTLNNLLILKFLQKFQQEVTQLSQLENVNTWLEALNIDQTSPDLQEVHKFFYREFQRFYVILDFLKRQDNSFQTNTIGTILQTKGILLLVFENNIEMSFEETRQAIESLHRDEWGQITETRSVRDLELQILYYYSVLTSIYDLIVADGIMESMDDLDCKNKLQELNGLLRQVRNFDALCSLLEDILQLIFLRWEQLEKNSIYQGKTYYSSAAQHMKSCLDSADEDIDDFKTSAANFAKQNYYAAAKAKQGFICRGNVLYTLLSFLKNVVTKKIHTQGYKLATESERLRLQYIIEIITEALWKHAIFKKIDDSILLDDSKPKFQLKPEELLEFLRAHVQPTLKTSSEDEIYDRCILTTSTRRRSSKKKRKTTFSNVGRYGGVSHVVASVGIVENAASTYPKSDEEAHIIKNKKAERSVIPRMLGSPINLAVMALALNNFHDAKMIIETFNLKNTELKEELYFVEKQQEVKEKLLSIYKNYNLQDQQGKFSMKPFATVDRIKAVAAKGFEVSKFISVIDSFALEHKLQQTTVLKQLISKHITCNIKYNFLRNFEENKLNEIIIMDLILTLSLDRDLTSNVLMVIKRQQSFAKLESSNTVNVKETVQDISVKSFLQNLCECMRLLKDKLTIYELLVDNYYSLMPNRLLYEINNEIFFETLIMVPNSVNGRYNDIKPFVNYFQNPVDGFNYNARFHAYVMHLTHLINLQNQNLEMKIFELLKTDPCTTIGHLIFECDMTPLDLEASAAALNLNLVHVIALNVCPQFGDRYGKQKLNISTQRQKAVLNYILHRNQLLSFLLKNVIDKECVYSNERKPSPVFINRFIQLPEIEELKVLYDNNPVIAFLRSDSINIGCLEHLPQLQKIKILKLEICNRVFASAQKNKIDGIILALIEENIKNIHLVKYIFDISVRAKVIQDNYGTMPSYLAKDLLHGILHHKAATLFISADLSQKLEDTLEEITIYTKVGELLQHLSWSQTYDFCLRAPDVIFQNLLEKQMYKLCYEWCLVVKLSDRFARFKQIILSTLLKVLLGLQGDNEMNTYLLRLLDIFPREDCKRFLDENKDKFRSLQLLEYAINFLIKFGNDDNESTISTTESYRNYQLSLEIFKQFSLNDRDEFWHIFKTPLLIIEQLIMNAKFEILAKVLQAVRIFLNEKTKDYVCVYCCDQRADIYDIYTKQSNSNISQSAFMLLNFNLYRHDHYITHECIDLLLRIYATKALDFNISEKYSSSSEQNSQLTDTKQSSDSLRNPFVMPKKAPSRSEWVKDADATNCMCCRRAAFSLLMRRHHCRRCGRVVCFACSTHSLLIPELYDKLEVRVCNDCHRLLEENHNVKRDRDHENNREELPRTFGHTKPKFKRFRWHLSGNITHDKLLREEFCYEHVPSVALCLSILNYHLGGKKCVDLLIYYCRKLEKLFVPNPEVDYELVAKMMNCLALAAKVRSGTYEIESIREHSDIVQSVVQNGCESLIPSGPLNKNSLRKLADALVESENWSLALEVHFKSGFPTTGVMAAYGLACLRAGCFNRAREKLSHCMPKLTNEKANALLAKFIFFPTGKYINSNASEWLKNNSVPKIRRPQRGPPLLQEILKIFASTTSGNTQSQEPLRRASVIRNSNSSIASMLSRRKEAYSIPVNEPALNILTALANSNRIAKGDYDGGLRTDNEFNLSATSSTNNANSSYSFDECYFYVLNYGSHVDFLQFLMQHRLINAVLRYFLAQQLNADLFIHNIFLVCLKCGEVPILIENMLQFDAQLIIWQQVLIKICRYLESQNLLNSLYQLQILLKDPVRASMTCVRFYTMNCDNFQKLHANAEHLHNALSHLQTELESVNWENVNMEQAKGTTGFLANAFRYRRGSRSSSRRLSNISLESSLIIQMDARSLNTHVNTILLQLEVTKFLAKCEVTDNKQLEELKTVKLLNQMGFNTTNTKLPTLFDDSPKKVLICVLVLYCGKNIEEGFGLAYRIIQNYKLSAMKVYEATTKYMSQNNRLSEVEHLLNCITSSNGVSNRELDEILLIAINSATSRHDPEVKSVLDNLIKKIHSIEIRISSHISIDQLKSAYLLANKHERLNDIRKILHHAELKKQIHIKRLCERKLNMTVSGDAGSSETIEKIS